MGLIPRLIRGRRCSFCASPTANPAGRRKRTMPLTRFLISGCALLALAVPATALAAGAASPTTTTTTTTTTPTTPGGTGGAGIGSPPASPSTPAQPTVSGYQAKIIDDVAYAPAD